MHLLNEMSDHGQRRKENIGTQDEDGVSRHELQPSTSGVFRVTAHGGRDRQGREFVCDIEVDDCKRPTSPSSRDANWDRAGWTTYSQALAVDASA